jgi:hypothetical protein
MKPILILTLVTPFVLAGCGGGGGGAKGGPSNIIQTLQLNSGTSTGLSISATVSVTDANGPSEAVSLNNKSGPNPATITVNTSGAISNVILNTINASLVGDTSSWTTPGDAVNLSISGLEACSGGNCNTSLRDLDLLAFQYLAFGGWGQDSGSSGNINSAAGFLTVGQPTPPANIPTSGNASYSGFSTGALIDSSTSTSSVLSANFSATADFSARTISVNTTGTELENSSGVTISTPQHNYSGTLGYAAGANQFSGTVNTASSGLTGTATGQFFGPSAQEIGGVFDLSGGTINAIGLFAGQK